MKKVQEYNNRFDMKKGNIGIWKKPDLRKTQKLRKKIEEVHLNK